MIRFDMSEYMERHTVSRLIGAPPGYVGFEQGGLLTDAIDQHPHSVLLLDEIEKAHPDLYNILLQVMDHGKLTDHNGKQISFRNVILVMTTNAGAADMARSAMGFTQHKRTGDDVEAINRMFAPEFRNRLDAVVPFSHLPTEVIAKVVDKFVMQLEAQLADRNVAIELSDEARAWLIERGYDQAMGARPMARVIQTHIKTPLADEVLFGRLKNGGTVRVVIAGDGAGFRSSSSSSRKGRCCRVPTRKSSRRRRKRSVPSRKCAPAAASPRRRRRFPRRIERLKDFTDMRNGGREAAVFMRAAMALPGSRLLPGRGFAGSESGFASRRPSVTVSRIRPAARLRNASNMRPDARTAVGKRGTRPVSA